VFTVRGFQDECIPVEDAFEFSKIIHNHKLHIVEDADRCCHQYEQKSSQIAHSVEMLGSELW
ncbi:hypothetical protein MKX03_029545, partial [Papaver bracteatum]